MATRTVLGYALILLVAAALAAVILIGRRRRVSRHGGERIRLTEDD